MGQTSTMPGFSLYSDFRVIPTITVDGGQAGPDNIPLSLSPRSLSGSRGRLHELTPCRFQSASPCRRQAEIERVQIVLNRSQPGLPRSTGSSSPVFGRTPNAGLKSSRMVLTGVGRIKMRQRKTARRHRRIVSDRSG